MTDIDAGPYDVLTSHAGARWRWIDVRPDTERESAPVQYTHFAIPLERLLLGGELPYDVDTSLAVFGEGFDDTAPLSMSCVAVGTLTSSHCPENAMVVTPGSFIRT
jgi:hypothetical protein